MIKQLAYSTLTAITSAYLLAFCCYKLYKQYYRGYCSTRTTYEFFEGKLMEVVHKEARKTESFRRICEYSTRMIRRGYLIKKIQQANSAMREGNTELAIKYLIGGMAVSSKPAVFLQCMSTSLPLNVYRGLLDKLAKLQ